MILALDISTSCCGLVIYDDINKKLVLADHIQLSFSSKKKKYDIFKKLEIVEQRLIEIKSQYDISDIVIEKSLLGFGQRKSSAKVLFLLAGFNQSVCWMTFKLFGKKPILISANTARRKCGVKQEETDTTIKDAVVRVIVNKDNTFVLEYKKTGKLKTYIYDRADAYVLALAHSA